MVLKRTSTYLVSWHNMILTLCVQSQLLLLFQGKRIPHGYDLTDGTNSEPRLVLVDMESVVLESMLSRLFHKRF